MSTYKKDKIIGFVLILLIVLVSPFILQGTPNVIFADGTGNGLSVNVINSINGVLGKTKTVMVTMKNENTGDNDWIYNVGLEVELDDGLEFVAESGIAPSFKKFELIDESDSEEGQKQILKWIDITDLAPGETYNFSFEVRILESYRGTIQKTEDEEGNEIDTEYEIEVNFGDNVTGNVTVNGSTDAQSFGDIGASDDFSFNVVPFEVIISGGGKMLKGAGEGSTADDDKYSQNITIEIINNTKYAVIVEELINTIANGVQVTDLKFGGKDVIYDNYKDKLYTKTVDSKTNLSILDWSNIELDAKDSLTLTYNAAIFDKYTTGAGVNEGEIIEDNTLLPISLSYKGCIKVDEGDSENGDEQNGEEKGKCEGAESIGLIAKDIIINKTNTYEKPIKHNSVFTYKIEAKVNQYHDISDIVITDTLGDGQEFVDNYETNGYKITSPSEGLTVTQAVYENKPNDGETKIIWTIGENFIAEDTYSLEFQAKVKDGWEGHTEEKPNPIVAGDSFANKVEITGRNTYTGKALNAEDSNSVSTPIPLPGIEKKIIDINGDTNPNFFKDDSGRYRVNIGDTIKFEVKYKANNIGVEQKEVEIVDIFPQGTKVDISSISYVDKHGNSLEGSPTERETWESGWKENNQSVGENDDPNILRWKFDYIEPEAELTVQYEVTVENEPENKDGKQTFNLAKMSVKNSSNRIKSERAQVEIVYTEPILEIEKTAIPTENLKGGDEVTFTITVTNTGMGTAYGVKVVDELPMELEYENDSATGATANHINGKITFTIDSISTGKNDNTATITYKAKVVNPIGALRSFKNTAKIEEYKNRNDGSSDTRTYDTDKPFDSVNLQAIKPTITMVVDSTSTEKADDLKVGDWVIYKVKVNIPTGTVAYNGYIEVDIPNAGTEENQEVLYISKTKENESGSNVEYDTNGVQTGYNIKFNTDSSASSGDHIYYIKTKIVGPTTESASEVQKGKAIFTWYDEDSTNSENEHDTDKTEDVQVTVNLPQLAAEITPKTESIILNEEISYTFTVKHHNNSKNTAYNFVPTIEVPPGFTISELKDKTGGGEGTPINLNGSNYTGFNTTDGGLITLPEENILINGSTKTYTFEAKLKVLQPAGSSNTFTGKTGEYYTNEDKTGYNFGSISDNATVSIPGVTIAQKIIETSNGEDSSYLYVRPGDTVDYKITVTVPQGTIAYDLNIVDTIPSDFEVVGTQTIINEDLGATKSDVTVDNGVATIELGEQNATSNAITIVKIIKLKAKTVKIVNDEEEPYSYGTYGVEGKEETNQVKADWKLSAEGMQKSVDAKDVNINVREPNLTIGTIATTNGTEFNNTTQEITLTIPVTNNRNTPAYNGEFTLEIPAEIEVVLGSISNGGSTSASNGKTIVTWKSIIVPSNSVNNGDGNGTKKFTVKLKLNSDEKAGAGKEEILEKFVIDSYDSKDDTQTLPAKIYPVGGKPSSAIHLSIAPVTIEKTVQSTTSLSDDYVRPGDNITYKVEITVPNNTTAYGLTFEDILGEEQELIEEDAITFLDGITAVEEEDGVYSLGNITGGSHTITVVSKIKTDTASDDKNSFSNKAIVKWDENKTGINSLVSGTIKQPNFNLTINKDDNDIEGPDGISTITVKLKKEGDVPAYNVETKIDIPSGLVVDEDSLPNGATLSGNKIIWKIDGSLNVDDTIGFKVKAKEGEEANSTHDIQGEVEYTSTADENSKLYTKDNVKCDVKLVGKHELSKANEGQGDGGAKLLEGQVEQTLTFTHVLKNTGAGKDTYEIDVSNISYSGVVKYEDADNDGAVKTFTHDNSGNWSNGEKAQITLSPGEEITLTYEITIPIEAPKEETKTHTITATSKSDSNQKESQYDKVKIIGIDYGGTVFDGITAPTYDDWQSNWKISTFAPGQQIKLTALTSHDITSVTAKIKRVDDNSNGYILNGNDDPVVISLNRVMDNEEWQKGKWMINYKLPDKLAAGSYFVEYESFNSNADPNSQDKDKTPTTLLGERGYNNYFDVETPDLNIKLAPDKSADINEDVIVVSDEGVIFTLTVDNINGKTDAYHVIPEVKLPEGVEFKKFITVTDAVYGEYDEDSRTIKFYAGDKIPFNIEKGEEIELKFKVETNYDLSADEVLNFPATTGPYYTALKNDGNPEEGTVQDEIPTSASLKTDTITFKKKIYSTTNSDGKYPSAEGLFVRPGDQIVYEIDIEIPNGLSINELKLKDIVNIPDSLVIEKIVIGNKEYTVDNGIWDSNNILKNANNNKTILVYARVKDNASDNTNTFTTKSTANLTWEAKYTDSFKDGSKTEYIEISGKRPHIIIDSFTSKDNKVKLENPDEVIEFTGIIKNDGKSTAYKTKVVASLPKGMVPVDGTYGNGEYYENDNTITWEVDEIDANEEKEITFNAKADIDKPLPANAEVKFELVEYRSTDHGEYFTEYNPDDTKEIPINADRKHTITGPFSEEEYAGNTVEFKHTITNTGGSRETFTIEVSGDSEFDIDYGPESVELAPGESREITITVTIPETMRKGDTDYEITLTTQGGNETVSTTTVNTLKILGEDLDGWVSNALWSKWEKDKYKEEWKETTYYINQPIKISAITAIDIGKVEIEIYKADDETKIGNSIILNNYVGTIKVENRGEEGNNTFKLWDNIYDKYDKDDLKDSLLGLGEGRYFVKYKAYRGDNVIEEDITLTEVKTDLGYNNYFTVKSNIKLKGTISLKEPETGDTVDGAEVRLVDLTGKPVINPETGEEYKTTVGSDGKYEFESVPINQYTLEVVPKSEKYKKYSKAIEVKPEPGKNEVVIDVELVGFSIDLKANPSTIVGDGDSRTILTTKVLCKDGLPVGGAEVKFKDLLAGKILGEAKDPKNPDGGYYDLPSDGKYITNEKGEVYIVYESEKIEGIVSQVIPVTAVVECTSKGIYGEDSIFITFEPASIKGVVKDNNTDKPVEGARVIVTSQDGSFSAEQITGPDGEYKIAIPKEGGYDIEIIKPVKIGDEIHNVSFKQKANVAEVTCVKSDPVPADVTFTGILKMADKDGKEDILKTVKDDKDKEKEVKVKQTGGGPLEGTVDKYTGVFSIDGLTKGTEYEFLVTTEINGKELLMGKIKVKITEDGEVNIHEELIDPYGTITDAKTGNVLGNVHVELYYADTARNTANGKAVNKPVPQADLGGIFAFPPNDNKNPQWSTTTLVYNNDPLVLDHGNYAWMVPPNRDYYIIATKSGYVTYDSRKDSNLGNAEKGSYFIKVDTDIVKYDFAMTPISSGGSGGGKGGGPSVPTVLKKPEEPVESDVPVESGLPESSSVAKDSTIESSSDKRAYLEEKEGEISIKYYIKEEPDKDIDIVFYIPEGAVVKDTDGGTIVGDKIVWKVDDSEIGKIAEKKLKIILPKITKMEETIETISELRVDGEIVDTSVLEIVVFSNRYGNGEHPRYIQGIPGGTFNPAANITRAEIAVIFSRILKLESLVKHEKMYDDVDIDDWHAKGIEAATKKGLFQGIGNNMFKPNQPITRGELAAVIARYLSLPDKKPIQLPFKDIDNNWAFTYITELYRNNIITGYQDGSFKPGGHLRRDEAVTMINRMLNRGPLKNVEPTYPDMPKENWAFGDVEECSRTHKYYRNEDSSETHVETIDEDLFF